MDDISTIYSEWFFEEIKKSEIDSSLDFAKIVSKHLLPNSIIDLGCGSAIYLKAFNDLGISDILGFDGSKFAVTTSLLPEKTFVHDLRTPLKLDKKYDLAMCIEVAEHIDEKYSEILIDNLIGLSDTILFTAATPNQGGYDHINEKPHEYWINLFKLKGYIHNEELSNVMKSEMYEKNVVWWIPDNLMIMQKYK